ncbi:MAG: hypothetical protein ABL974_17115, partial [Prosthecobacter sp.]
MNRIVTPSFQGRITAGRGLAVSAGLRGSLVSKRGASGGRSLLLAGVEPEQLRAGRGVQISGRDVIVQADAQTTTERAEETWELVIWGRIRGSFLTPFDTGLVTCGGVFRASGEMWASSLWESTQIVAGTDADDENFTRSFTLELQSRSQDGDFADFETAIYRLPVRLVIEEIEDAL